MSYSASKTNDNKDDVASSSTRKPKEKGSTALLDLIGQIDNELELVQALQAPNFDIGESDLEQRVPLFARKDIYIQFAVNDIICGFPLIHTLEITYFTDIIKLPNLPPWLLGVFNLKGEVITLVDLKRIFNIFSGEIKKSKHILIVRYNNIKTGLIVDKVSGTYIMHKEDKKSQPTINMKGMDKPYISGAFKSEGKTINLIDIEKLFSTLESI